MSSSVYFRMHHGNQLEPINFTGHQITLLDLKRAIMEVKNFKGLDFDLKVTDAENSAKVFTGDETYVPKNTTVIVRRVPVPAGQGLLSRLQNTHAGRGGHAAPPRTDKAIVIPPKVPPKPVELETVKIEAPSVVVVSKPAPASVEQKASAELAAEEEALALAKLSQKVAARPARPGGNKVWEMESSSGSLTGGGAGGAEGPAARRPPPPSTALRPGYECNRCGKPGHHIRNCPTNGNPAYDRGGSHNGGRGGEGGPGTIAKIRGVPTNSIQFVKDLSGIDTTGKIVRETKEGFEILEASVQGFQSLVKQGGATASVSSLNMEAVPNELRCALSGKILRDAVTSPCCNKVVSDASYRDSLFRSSQLQCPLCRRTGVSPDELRPQHDMRKRVEEYLARSVGGSGAADGPSPPAQQLLHSPQLAPCPDPIAPDRPADAAAVTSSGVVGAGAGPPRRDVAADMSSHGGPPGRSHPPRGHGPHYDDHRDVMGFPHGAPPPRMMGPHDMGPGMGPPGGWGPMGGPGPRGMGGPGPGFYNGPPGHMMGPGPEMWGPGPMGMGPGPMRGPPMYPPFGSPMMMRMGDVPIWEMPPLSREAFEREQRRRREWMDRTGGGPDRGYGGHGHGGRSRSGDRERDIRRGRSGPRRGDSRSRSRERHLSLDPDRDMARERIGDRDNSRDRGRDSGREDRSARKVSRDHRDGESWRDRSRSPPGTTTSTKTGDQRRVSDDRSSSRRSRDSDRDRDRERGREVDRGRDRERSKDKKERSSDRHSQNHSNNGQGSRVQKESSSGGGAVSQKSRERDREKESERGEGVRGEKSRDTKDKGESSAHRESASGDGDDHRREKRDRHTSSHRDNHRRDRERGRSRDRGDAKDRTTKDRERGSRLEDYRGGEERPTKKARKDVTETDDTGGSQRHSGKLKGRAVVVSSSIDLPSSKEGRRSRDRWTPNDSSNSLSIGGGGGGRDRRR